MIQNTTISLSGKAPPTIVVFENADFTTIAEMAVERPASAAASQCQRQADGSNALGRRDVRAFAARRCVGSCLEGSDTVGMLGCLSDDDIHFNAFSSAAGISRTKNRSAEYP